MMVHCITIGDNMKRPYFNKTQCISLFQWYFKVDYASGVMFYNNAVKSRTLDDFLDMLWDSYGEDLVYMPKKIIIINQ